MVYDPVITVFDVSYDTKRQDLLWLRKKKKNSSSRLI